VTIRRNRGYAVRSTDAIDPNPPAAPPRHAADATRFATTPTKPDPQFAASESVRLMDFSALSWLYPVYAHMHDQTLMTQWLATKDRINSAGERVELLTPEITDEAAWLKHELARAKQTLPDGECGLPIQQTCPHPNKCHSCPSFLTDERYRPVLAEQLERAQAKLSTAEKAGHARAAEINRPDVVDLRRILEGLDRLSTDSAAPALNAGLHLRDPTPGAPAS
jgi:hypothetical protein